MVSLFVIASGQVNVRPGFSHNFLLQNRILELQSIEAEGHEKALTQLRLITELFEQSGDSERDVKRPKIDESAPKNNTIALFLPQQDTPSPLKSIFQGLASQVLHALVRELTSRGTPGKSCSYWQGHLIKMQKGLPGEIL
jgi:hypothetical protein